MKRLIPRLTLMLVLLSACAAAGGETSGVTEQTGPDSPPAATQPIDRTDEDAPVPPEQSTAQTPEPPLEPEQPENTKEADSAPLSYPIVDTCQSECFDTVSSLPCPAQGAAFFGQDAQYAGRQSAYLDNDDGTVSDIVTGLMWQRNPGSKMTYAQAIAGVEQFSLAGYDDWRLPTIKELYSLILFDGTDVSFCPGGTCRVVPFIDDRYFDFSYGDITAGERVIDSQFASATKYVSTTMNGQNTDFGVNFADGRIKGYGLGRNDSGKTFYVLYVRGNPGYGVNDFVDNGDGTVSDLATGLTWMQSDSAAGMDWQSALDYCENSQVAGYDDWRLPDAKELQSIIDYSRSPLTSNSPAIDPLFSLSSITNEAGEPDYPYFWSSTTHTDAAGHGSSAVYLAFGTAPGYWQDQWMDVHGAGAQRSDPKSGSAAAYPTGHGPQGDAIRVDNYVRCVHGGNVSLQPEGVAGVDRPARTVESVGIQQQGGNQNAPRTRGSGQAPQQAIDACTSSGQGDACQFDTPNGMMNGICTLLEQLTCVPASGGTPAQQP